MSDELAKRIEDAEKLADQCRDRFNDAIENRNKLIRDHALREFGVAVGMLVRKVRDGKPAGIYRVDYVDVRWYPARPWIKGCRRKKDGTFEDRASNLLNEWELIADG